MKTSQNTNPTNKFMPSDFVNDIDIAGVLETHFHFE